MADFHRKLEGYQRTILKARDWAYRNWDRILKEPDLQGHYKAPYMWAVTGDMKMGGAHRRHFEQSFLRSDGDFRMEERFKGFKGFPCTAPNQYIYSNGWIISGMQKLGAYDIANKGLEFVLRFQDATHGGFYCSYDPVSEAIDSCLMDSSRSKTA